MSCGGLDASRIQNEGRSTVGGQTYSSAGHSGFGASRGRARDSFEEANRFPMPVGSVECGAEVDSKRPNFDTKRFTGLERYFKGIIGKRSCWILLYADPLWGYCAYCRVKGTDPAKSLRKGNRIAFRRLRYYICIYTLSYCCIVLSARI